MLKREVDLEVRWEIRFDICRDRVPRGVSDFRFGGSV